MVEKWESSLAGMSVSVAVEKKEVMKDQSMDPLMVAALAVPNDALLKNYLQLTTKLHISLPELLALMKEINVVAASDHQTGQLMAGQMGIDTVDKWGSMMAEKMANLMEKKKVALQEGTLD